MGFDADHSERFTSGFFGAVPDKPARAPRVKLNANAINPDALGCDACELKRRWPALMTPRMATQGEAEASLLVLGEAPGEQEDRDGAPFVGDSGKLLRKLLPARFRSRIAYSNAVRCRPEDNATPTAQEIYACSLHLEADVKARPFKAILGVGGVPLSRYISPSLAPITRIRGVKFPVRIGANTLWYYPILHPAYLLRLGGEDSSAYPLFDSDIRRFFREAEDWPKPHIYDLRISDVTCVETEVAARQALANLRPGVVGLDLETVGLQPFFEDSKILSAAVSDGKHTIAWPIDHPGADAKEWGWALLDEIVTSRPWVAHNAAFELLWIWHRKRNWMPGKFFDSMGFGRILHRRESLLGLDVMSRIVLGVNVKALSNLDVRKLIAYPLSEVLPYNGLDALACFLIYEQLANDKNIDQWQINKILRTVVSTVAMQLQGLPPDRSASEILYDQFDGKRAAAVQAASQTYEARQFQLDKGHLLNIGSPEQVGEALVKYANLSLPKTAKGQYSTDESILRKHAENPLAAGTLNFREANKLISTYIEPIRTGSAIGLDGNIHPGYTSMLTATMRLSGESFSTQNWPKRKHREIRRQIRAPPGHLLFAFDYGQLEARVIAMLSQDKALCEAIITGYDIHADWRDRLLKLYSPYWDRLKQKSGETVEAKILKAGRDNIKNDFVFAAFFGSAAASLAENTDVPLPIMTRLLDEFWETFAGVRKWIRGQRSQYKSTGTVSTLTGRQRNSIMNGNEPINTPVQGTAADIVLCAQNELCDMALERDDPYLFPRINVHDDLTFLLPNTSASEDYIMTIKTVLVRRRFPWLIVPLMVELQVGENWADMIEVSKFTGDYHH